MKYHHLERCFTYRMKRPMVLVLFGVRTVKVWEYKWQPHFHGRCADPFGVKPPFSTSSEGETREDPTVLATEPIGRFGVRESCFETSARWGVWLGRHACYTTTQVSYGELSGNRNLTWNISVKACLINDFQYESRLRKQGQRSFAKNRKYEQIIPEVSE